MPTQDYTKWHLPKGAKARLGKGYINEIAYSPDSNRLAVASSIGIWIYDAETGEELNLFMGHTGPVERLAYSPNARFIASSSYSSNARFIAGSNDHKTVRLWGAVTGEQKAILNHANNVTDFLYSPDGSTIITNSEGKVCLWDAITGEYQFTIAEHAGRFDSFAYSLDGKTIAAWKLNEKEVHFLNIATGKHVDAKEANFHDFHESITYSSDGSTFATAEQQGIYLRDESIMYSPDGSTFATAEQQGIYLRDTVTGKHKTTLATDTYIDYDEIPFTEYGPDGCTIASLVSNVHSDAGRMYLWELLQGNEKSPSILVEAPSSTVRMVKQSSLLPNSMSSITVRMAL